MKTLVIILMLFFTAVVHHHTKAQSFKGYYKPKVDNPIYRKGNSTLEIGVQTNRSVRGWRTGWNVDWAFANKFRLGYFRTSGKSNPEQVQSVDQGLELSLMLNANKEVSFGPQVRTTVTDRQFVSIIPMVQTRVSISRHLALKGSAGISDRYPIFDMGVVMKLN